MNPIVIWGVLKAIWGYRSSKSKDDISTMKIFSYISDLFRNLTGNNVIETSVNYCISSFWEILHEYMVLRRKLQEVANQCNRCVERKCFYIFFDHILYGYIFLFFSKSSIRPRDGVGIRIHWGKGRSVGFFERWNPLASSIPYTTLISHPLEHGMEPNSIYEVRKTCDWNFRFSCWSLFEKYF